MQMSNTTKYTKRKKKNTDHVSVIRPVFSVWYHFTQMLISGEKEASLAAGEAWICFASTSLCYT